MLAGAATVVVVVVDVDVVVVEVVLVVLDVVVEARVVRSALAFTEASEPELHAASTNAMIMAPPIAAAVVRRTVRLHHGECR